MSGIQVLEERHMVSVILFLKDNDGCMKTELYSSVSNNPRMPAKLDSLESAGLIRQEQSPESRAVRIHLTDLGREVASLLSELDSVMSGRETR